MMGQRKQDSTGARVQGEMSPEHSLEGQAELQEAREVEGVVGFSKGVLYRA